MKKALIPILALLLAAAPCAFAAGSVTWTIDNKNRFIVYRCAWTSDASGNVSAGAGVDGVTVTGKLKTVNFKSVSGSIPTNLYDVQLLTAGGENVLYDASNSVNVGADIPSALNSTGQRRSPFNTDGSFKTLYNEVLTPSISNAGNAMSGVIELIVE